jgi:hypothetical protein
MRQDEQNKIPLTYVLKNFYIKNHLDQIFNFQHPKNHFPFLFPLSFPFWSVSISSPIFLAHLILLAIFFIVELAVRPNRTFGPPTQFPLVIFDLLAPIASPFPFLSPVTGIIKVPPPLSPPLDHSPSATL